MSTMSTIQIEQKTFSGGDEELIERLSEYLDETKEVLTVEVLRGQVGFGIAFYTFLSGSDNENESASVTLIKGDHLLRDLDWDGFNRPINLYATSESWSITKELIKGWSLIPYPEPIHIESYDPRFESVFFYGLTPPTEIDGQLFIIPEDHLECYIFRSICSGSVPLLLVDGIMAPPRRNALCVLEVAPDETLLYSRIKALADESPRVQARRIIRMLQSKDTATLLEAFKKINKSHFVESLDDVFEDIGRKKLDLSAELTGALVDACFENLSTKDKNIQEIIEYQLFPKYLLSADPYRLKLLSVMAPKIEGKIDYFLNHRKPFYRRLAAKYLLSISPDLNLICRLDPDLASKPDLDISIIERLSRDSNIEIRDLVARKLSTERFDGAEELDGAREEKKKRILFNLTRDHFPSVRYAAVSALNYSLKEEPDEKVFEALVPLLHDKNQKVRLEAIRAFRNEAASPWVEEILKLIKHPDVSTHATAAVALRWLADETHLPIMKEIFNQRGLSNSSALGITILIIEGDVASLQPMAARRGLFRSPLVSRDEVERAKMFKEKRSLRSHHG